MADRAIVFVDGNNWYHSLRGAGVDDLAQLNYAKISRKLLGPRDWIGTRYYIGQVQQHTNTRLYADQRSFLASLRATDVRITCHLGRLETRLEKSEAAQELREYLATLHVRIDKAVFHDLMALAQRHERLQVTVEKAVDVMLAVDMVVMAERGEYDAAYVLSADGDLTPAVTAVRDRGKKVYASSPSHGAQLGAVVNSFIRLVQRSPCRARSHCDNLYPATSRAPPMVPEGGSYKCDACGVEFAPPDQGDICVLCLRPFCSRHLSPKKTDAGPLCRTCGGSS